MGNRNGLLWFKRRMNDSELLNDIGEIIDEGFDFIFPCEYKNQYDVFLGEIVYSASITFINSYEELYNSDYVHNHDFINFVYDFIELRFKSYIKKRFLDWIVECEDDDNLISEQTSGVPMYFRRRYRSDEFKKILEIIMEYWIKQTGQNITDFMDNVITETLYGYFMTNYRINPYDRELDDVHSIEDFVNDEYGEYIKTYYIDNYM
jgi:hypothetical protein